MIVLFYSSLFLPFLLVFFSFYLFLDWCSTLGHYNSLYDVCGAALSLVHVHDCVLSHLQFYFYLFITLHLYVLDIYLFIIIYLIQLYIY